MFNPSQPIAQKEPVTSSVENAGKTFSVRSRTFLKTLYSQKLEGLGTVEIVIIIGVLVAIAMIFREQITTFAQSLMDKVFNESILDKLGS